MEPLEAQSFPGTNFEKPLAWRFQIDLLCLMAPPGAQPRHRGERQVREDFVSLAWLIPSFRLTKSVGRRASRESAGRELKAWGDDQNRTKDSSAESSY